jgi:protein-L-isoaspartate(D-aspartate) O-methyltransferase
MDFNKENEKLIEHIKSYGYLKSKELEKALREIPRHLFVPENIRKLSYRDTPLSIGFGQTISQPSTVVIMTEALEVKEGNKILEVGTGSGWQAAILGKLVGEKGSVYTVEVNPQLVEFARENLKKVGMKNVKVFEGDGSTGLKKHAPFDRIIVTAAAPDFPKPLIEQLKIGGIMVIPVGNIYLQEMYVVKKFKDKIEKKSIGPFMFVPLIGKYGFKVK